MDTIVDNRGLALPKTDRKNERHRSLLAILIFASLSFAAATGRLTPHHVDDTPSYLAYPFDSLSSALNSIRTPGYPLVLQSLQRTVGLAAVPAFQWIVLCIAAWCFAMELRQWKASRLAMWVSAFAIVFGCTSLDHQSTLATDALAATVGVGTVASTLRWIRRGHRHIDAVIMISAAMFAIMLRPAYLPIVVWIGCVGIVLMPPLEAFSPTLKSRVFSVTRVWACCGLLLLGWMTMRWMVVDDFGLLPFGHQNLAGLTLQMVSDEELKEIAKEDSDPMTMRLVNQVLAERHRGWASLDSGSELPLGDSFQPGPGLSTMTIERQWNEVIYRAAVPASFHLYPSDPVTRHRVIGHLNRQIVQRYPVRYLRWLALAFRRAVWGTAANILMNPLFFCFWLIAGFFWIANVITNQPWRVNDRDNRHKPPLGSEDSKSTIVTLLAVIAISYSVVMVSFVVLTSPPLGRFADASAILIPCWLMTWACEALLAGSEKAA